MLKYTFCNFVLKQKEPAKFRRSWKVIELTLNLNLHLSKYLIEPASLLTR